MRMLIYLRKEKYNINLTWIFTIHDPIEHDPQIMHVFSVDILQASDNEYMNK